MNDPWGVRLERAQLDRDNGRTPTVEQKKGLIPVGTEVVYRRSAWNRTFRHDGRLCVVLEAWVKVAGAVPRNYYKYRLRDLEEPEGSRFAEFVAEDGGEQSVRRAQ